MRSLAIAAALLASGCATDNYGMSPMEVAELQANIRASNEARGVFNSIRLYEETREIEFTYGSPEVMRMSIADYENVVNRVLTGYTIVTRNQAHGTQIEYYAPDGRVALWYPGNSRAVLGRFRTRQSFEPFNAWGDVAGVLICFSYSQNSYNPVTGHRGDGEQCTSTYAHIASIRGKHAGDVFGLLDGSVPFVMDRDDIPLWPNGESVISDRAPHSLEG